MKNEILIKRIRTAQDVYGTDERALAAIRETIMEGGISEEDFFLAWKAAEVLGKQPECLS